MLSELLTRRVLRVFLLSIVLLGCTEKKEIKPPVDASQIADTIETLNSEPLSSNKKTVSDHQITEFSLAFIDLLIDGKFKEAREWINLTAQEKYSVQKLETNFKRLVAQAGKTPKAAEKSMIIDRRLISKERKGVADVYISLKGSKGVKALYLGVCSDSKDLKVCHIGWGTEDTGEFS